MFDWGKAVLILLQLVQWGVRKAEANAQWNAGAQAEAFAASKAVLAMTAQGKLIVEKIDAMDDGGLDQLERDLTSGDTKPK